MQDIELMRKLISVEVGKMREKVTQDVISQVKRDAWDEIITNLTNKLESNKHDTHHFNERL